MSFSNGAHYNLSVAGRPVNKPSLASNESQNDSNSRHLARLNLAAGARAAAILDPALTD
ncbi:MAG: hypothetical protein ACRC9V_11365 [Aeromonas sp.]